MEVQKQLVGIVIRPDGTVPFDDDVPSYFRASVLAHLMDQGHVLEPVHTTRHVRIRNWTPKNS